MILITCTSHHEIGRVSTRILNDLLPRIRVGFSPEECWDLQNTRHGHVKNQELFILFEIAGACWAEPWPFNGHPIHRIPASPPTAKSQELSLPPSDRRHLAHWTMHLATPEKGLLPQAVLISSRSFDCIGPPHREGAACCSRRTNSW